MNVACFWPHCWSAAVPSCLLTETTEAARLGGGRSFGGKPFMSVTPRTRPSSNRPKKQTGPGR